MQRWLIHGLNSLLLIVILIGIPAITSTRFGSLQLSSVPRSQTLTLWGLALSAVANFIAAILVVKARKERARCWGWAGAFLAQLAVQYLHFNGYFNFDWLKKELLWLRNHF